MNNHYYYINKIVITNNAIRTRYGIYNINKEKVNDSLVITIKNSKSDDDIFLCMDWDDSKRNIIRTFKLINSDIFKTVNIIHKTLKKNKIIWSSGIYDFNHELFIDILLVES